MLRAALGTQATGPLPYAMGLLPAAGVPHYFRFAHGVVLEDVDGNRLIDLHNGWGSAILGHGAPEVAEAVGRVLRDGVAALPTELEARVAERLVALRPWAASVRFAKTGSDAMVVAIRLARALDRARADRRRRATTAGTTLPRPQCWGSTASPRRCVRSAYASTIPTRTASHRSWRRTGLQPSCWSPRGTGHRTRPGSARSAPSHAVTGRSFIHDEVASGLRAPRPQLLGIDPPDLTVLGKGLANGLPLAAVLGHRAVMAPAGPGYLLYSGSTHETVALAAAEVVLTRLGDPAMAAALARADDEIRRALAIGEDCLRVEGHPGMILLRPPPGTVVAPTALRLLLVQELLAHNIYCLGAIYPSGAYDEAALDTLRVAISGAMGAVSWAVLENQVAERLRLEMTNREIVRGAPLQRLAADA